jgi:hypothetical protein
MRGIEFQIMLLPLALNGLPLVSKPKCPVDGLDAERAYKFYL